ncbi:hypothetical protein GCM10010495_52390 [Kitasatospora herbaricolor]|uniref:hypothetical protein n=1 Tax=Kitasatospora herbaricolor TaxID=68217 RepID=UPI0017494BFF|nr:hypothetical protein [Kitasatospora herbaricolor]MDQ0312596.1 hypothetical protein [Kitasatospora herbaricolor]GGV29729.1 hypothetical protein GCM10010495_52390 [Kitasatospora herbaricolor]
MLRRTAAPILAALLLSAGCSSAHTAPVPPAAGTSAAPTAPDHSGQSLWHVIDSNGNTVTQLGDDDPVVTAVRKTVVLHSGAVDNRDHRTIGESTTQEFTFYNKGFADQLRSQQYDTKLAALFTANHLTTRQVSIAWYRSTFPEDMTTAKVQMDSTIEFTEADPAYLSTNKFELNKPYTQHRTISLTKTGDTWTITAIEKNPLEAPAPPKPTS